MKAVDVIRTKRDGHRLSDEQIRWFISNYTRGQEVADEQASALLMAIFWRGMDTDELVTWTEAMVDSGDRLDLSGLDRPTVDKHSTGGVGDKTSLIVVPMLAACGAAVPQLSGRGLGHTGGTLDKMEAIPGWRAQMSHDALRCQLNSVGGVIAGAGDDLAPADRKLYALRDVTATVESIPLIASSIMSKKIAEGATSLVLDVKVGRGAFLPDLPRARKLATSMVELGSSHGVQTVALLTRMDSVLGRAAGNAIEVQEALDVLEGHGPPDVTELSLALATEMATLAGVDADPTVALSTGAALDAFHAMVSAQGGSLETGLPTAPHRVHMHALKPGHVAGLDARAVGDAAWHLGAGRSHKDEPVSHTAGVTCLVKPGDEVRIGQPTFELHTDRAELIPAAEVTLHSALQFGPTPTEPPPLIIGRIP